MGTGSKKNGAAGKRRELINGHRGSGMSISAYCRRKGVPDAGFYVWRKRLGEKPREALKGFVRLSAPESPRHTVVIRTPGGYCLEVPVRTDVDYLKEILITLGGLK
jgi:hypothetical protein